MPDQGEVLAIGPGKRLGDGRVCAPSVKIGERVLFVVIVLFLQIDTVIVSPEGVGCSPFA